MASYSEVMDPLQRLLEDFGPPRRSTPAYPFYHLSNDGIWELSVLGNFSIVGSPSDRFLLDNNASGGFSEEIHSSLIDNSGLIRTIAWMVLKQSFPDSLHMEILQAVGLDLGSAGKEVEVLSVPRPRDSGFRERILVAYSFSCAVCGFNVWLGRLPVALEAHILNGTRREALIRRITVCCFAPCTISCLTGGCLALMKIFRSRFLKRRMAERDLNSGLPDIMVNQSAQERPHYKPKENYIDWHFREVFWGPEMSAG